MKVRHFGIPTIVFFLQSSIYFVILNEVASFSSVKLLARLSLLDKRFDQF
jgi:hypothetical protein